MKCVDDILLYDDNIESAFWHTYSFLETRSRKGITLNPEKFRFCQREATFIGFLIGWDNYSPTEERLTAVWDTYSFLETCSRRGITLNPEMFRFC